MAAAVKKAVSRLFPEQHARCERGVTGVRWLLGLLPPLLLLLLLSLLLLFLLLRSAAASASGAG